ncbi:MAG TPA: hypothetical protein VNT33_06800, partial [Telluria sp.]|nr:hypothetical protein [Telluria sp.]
MNDNPPDEVVGAQRQQMLDALRERQRDCAARRFAERGEARKATDTLSGQGLFLAVDGAQRVADRAARKRGQRRADAGLVEAAARVLAEPAPSVTAAFERLIGRND